MIRGGGSLSCIDGTRLSSLSSAVDFLFHCPYGCLEQRTAAVLPLVIFKDYLSVFGLQSEVKDVKATVESELALWAKYQTAKGGLPYWPDAEGNASYDVSLRRIRRLLQQKGLRSTYCRLKNSFPITKARFFVKKIPISSLTP
jgi:hypothetical protein